MSRSARNLIAEFIEQYETHDARVWAEDADEAADELMTRLAKDGWRVVSRD